MSEQPRTPAGSPDGGQFAATAGAESDTLLESPAPHQTDELSYKLANGNAVRIYRQDPYDRSKPSFHRAELCCGKCGSMIADFPDHSPRFILLYRGDDSGEECTVCWARARREQLEVAGAR